MHQRSSRPYYAEQSSPPGPSRLPNPRKRRRLDDDSDFGSDVSFVSATTASNPSSEAENEAETMPESREGHGSEEHDQPDPTRIVTLPIRSSFVASRFQARAQRPRPQLARLALASPATAPDSPRTTTMNHICSRSIIRQPGGLSPPASPSRYDCDMERLLGSSGEGGSQVAALVSKAIYRDNNIATKAVGPFMDLLRNKALLDPKQNAEKVDRAKRQLVRELIRLTMTSLLDHVGPLLEDDTGVVCECVEVRSGNYDARLRLTS